LIVVRAARSLSDLRARPPCSTLFPYTTLFRSGLCQAGIRRSGARAARHANGPEPTRGAEAEVRSVAEVGRDSRSTRESGLAHARSEEHTSELQSRFDLVCRLLLEKKNVAAAVR